MLIGCPLGHPADGYIGKKLLGDFKGNDIPESIRVIGVSYSLLTRRRNGAAPSWVRWRHDRRPGPTSSTPHSQQHGARPDYRDHLRNRAFLDRKAALARLLVDTEAGIVLNEHVAADGPTVFAHACRLGAEGIVSKRVDGTYRSGPCSVWIKVRNPASVAVQRERSENWNK